MASKYKRTGTWKGVAQYNQSSRYTPPKPWRTGPNDARMSPNQPKGSAVYVPPKRPAAPAAPAAPAPQAPGYDPQALPFDAQYEQQMAGAQRGYENNMAGLQYQEGATRQEYGFDDVSNPFNRAAMLQQAYQRGVAQRRNVAGSRMYSSAFGAGETEGRSQHDQQYGNLRSTYDAKLNDITQKRLQAATDRDQGQITAYGERIARAPAAEDPGPLPAPAAAAGVKGKAGPKPGGSVLRPGQKPPPIHSKPVGTLTVGQRPGKYASVKPIKPKPKKKSRYAGRVM